MASIALIARKITPQVLETAKGLYQHKNQVRIITSYQQKIEDNFDFEILCYFKKWSPLEALKLLPKILIHPPEIFHFFFEDENETASAAHWILLSFAESLQKATVVSLLGKKIHSKNWRFNPFLKFSKAVAVPNRERLMYLKRRKLISLEKINEVILPFQYPHNKTESHDDELNAFLKSIQPYLFIPTHPRLEFIQMLDEIISDLPLNVLFLGPRTKNLNKYKKFYALAEESPHRLQPLVTMAQAVLLSFHEFEAIELMRWQQLAYQAETPIIARSQQVELLPGLCLNEKNGFVIEKSKLALKKLFLKNPKLKLASFYKNQVLLASNDQSLNDLSRLYAKALN